MLTLLLGRSGSGKSTAILHRIQENGSARQQVLIVPEQASYETERRLCATNGNDSSRYAEVFSFTSLAQRVSSLSGGFAQPMLDEGGRLLVMYTALRAVESNLQVYAPSAQKPEFLTQLIAAVDDLKSCCVSPEQVDALAEMSDDSGAARLRELALIYGAYDAMTAQGAADPRDNLTRMARALVHFPFVAEKDCYLDGFTDFTPQEEQVLQELLLQSHSLTLSLTCDSLEETEDPIGVFAAARHTAHTFLRLAKQNHIPVSIVYPKLSQDTRPPALVHLETALFAASPTAYQGEDTECVKLSAARNRREEVEWVAEQISALLHEGEHQYRDIAVSARSMEPYQELIAEIFPRYRIAVYQSAMQPILQKPVFSLLTSALDVITGQYRYEDLFHYLKSGLAPISAEECDLLENYALLWNLRGSVWTSARGFYQNPSGFESRDPEREEELLKSLNSLRCKVISPFIHFQEKCKDSTASKVISLYEFSEEIHLPERLQEHAEALLARGEPELALEYQQLWDILGKALEQCHDILGDMSIGMNEFAKLLRLLFSRYSVGSIPLSLDRIISGDLPRLENRQVKTMFILGADETHIPLLAPRQSLFSTEDLLLFSDYGITLSPPIDAQLKREMTILYRGCTQASQRLFISRPLLGEGGVEIHPSLLLERLSTIFPSLIEQTSPTQSLSYDPIRLQIAALTDPLLRTRMLESSTYRNFVLRLEAAAAWRRGTLSSRSVDALYGQQLFMSPSRLDKYKSCRFAYFLQYALKAKARRRAGFHAPEYGTFVHYVLEAVLREAKTQGGVSALTNDTLESLTQTAIQRYANEQLGGLEGQTPRFRYLFSRLRRTVSLVVHNVADELRNSDFQPVFFELGFGVGKELPPVQWVEGNVTLSISGFVDRVDAWLKDGRLYLKVVDYKTGRKSFDFTEIWNGLGLQMLLYLFALEEHPALFGDYTLQPAGLLYLPARDVLVSGSRSMPETQRRHLVEKELTRKGLILDDPAVLEALELPSDTGPRFLPIRVSSKTGKISGDALVSAERLGRLKGHIEHILRDICDEVRNGEVPADPYWRGPSQNACLYCDYAAACQFDESHGEERRRWIATVRNSDFWSYLEEGGDLDGRATD